MSEAPTLIDRPDIFSRFSACFPSSPCLTLPLNGQNEGIPCLWVVSGETGTPPKSCGKERCFNLAVFSVRALD